MPHAQKAATSLHEDRLLLPRFKPRKPISLKDMGWGHSCISTICRPSIFVVSGPSVERFGTTGPVTTGTSPPTVKTPGADSRQLTRQHRSVGPEEPWKAPSPSTHETPGLLHLARAAGLEGESSVRSFRPNARLSHLGSGLLITAPELVISQGHQDRIQQTWCLAPR